MGMKEAGAGIFDFFSGAIDTLDNVAGSDTAKLFAGLYSQKQTQDHDENMAEFDAQESVTVLKDTVVTSGQQEYFSLSSLTPFIPIALGLLAIPIIISIIKR